MGNQKSQDTAIFQVRISENAIRNIDEITDYIALNNQQPVNAARVGDALFLTIDRIGQDPFRFKECKLIPTKTKMYRQVRCFNWYIIFKIKGPEILILGVIHSSRKPSHTRRLRKEK